MRQDFYSGTLDVELMHIDTGASAASGDAPADTTAAALPPARLGHELDSAICMSEQAPTDYRHLYATGREPYLSGIPGEPRACLPGYDSGVAAMVLGVFLVLALSLRHYSTFLKNFTHDLWSLRGGDNMFGDRTVSETRILLCLVLLLCLSEAILMQCVGGSGLTRRFGVFAVTAGLTLVAGGYYLFQLAAYSVLGYVFTTPEYSRQWLRGFNASQALLAVLLWVPAMAALFNPVVSRQMFICGIILYIIARIIFISKGFRIFYNNLFSLVYFILYLCSLEIIPLFLAYKTSLSLGWNVV